MVGYEHEVRLAALDDPAVTLARPTYRYCATPHCPVVYYGDGEAIVDRQIVDRQNVRVPVSSKDPGSARWGVMRSDQPPRASIWILDPDFVDHFWPRPAHLLAILLARLAAGTLGILLGLVSGKGGSLPLDLAKGLLQKPTQPLVLLAQLLVLAFELFDPLPLRHRHRTFSSASSCHIHASFVPPPR
jgi:hypothetical protein